MGITEIIAILAVFSSTAGGIMSIAFNSISAYWATQILAGVLGLVDAIIYFFG